MTKKSQQGFPHSPVFARDSHNVVVVKPLPSELTWRLPRRRVHGALAGSGMTRRRSAQRTVSSPVLHCCRQTNRRNGNGRSPTASGGTITRSLVLDSSRRKRHHRRCRSEHRGRTVHTRATSARRASPSHAGRQLGGAGIICGIHPKWTMASFLKMKSSVRTLLVC